MTRQAISPRFAIRILLNIYPRLLGGTLFIRRRRRKPKERPATLAAQVECGRRAGSPSPATPAGGRSPAVRATGGRAKAGRQGSFRRLERRGPCPARSPRRIARYPP